MLNKSYRDKYLKKSYLAADRLMLYLIGLHFFFAVFISSLEYETYMFGLVNGGFLLLITLVAYTFFKGQQYFRILVGIVLMIFSTIYVQQHLGRIEFHFHIFIAISFLTIYKDHIPVVAAGITTSVYHIIFNILQQNNIELFGLPLYIFSYGCGWDIVFLHVFFVVMEVILISLFIKQNRTQYIDVLVTRDKYQDLSETLENEVLKQTHSLRKINDLYEESQAITHMGNWEWDMVTNSLVWNDEIYRIFGLEPQSVIPTYDTFIGYVHPDDRAMVQKSVEDAIEFDTKYDITHKLILLDNRIKYVRERGQVYRDEQNKPVRMVGTVQDVTIESKVKRELEDSENKFRIMSEKTTTAIFIYRDKFCYVNNAMEDITGYSKEELYDINPTFLIADQDIEKANKNILRRLAGEEFTEVYEALPITTKSGEKKIVSLHLSTISYKDSHAGLGTLIDITESKNAQREIKTLSQVVEQTDDIVKITKANGTITYVNDAFVAHTGYTRREALGKKANILRSGKHDIEFYVGMWNTILSGHVYRSVVINRKKDGTLYHEEQTITPIVDENGKVSSFVSTGKDISDRILLEEKLTNMAITDKLTNIFNRHKFDEMLNSEIERYRRYKTPFSIIMLDIDHFKSINDRYGHDIGDIVLVEISNLMKISIRNTDQLARWGGEEFMVLCTETDIEDAKVLSEKLRLLIENYNFDTVASVTSSFGITSFEEDDDYKKILKRVDDALYMAKDQGRNRVVYL